MLKFRAAPLVLNVSELWVLNNRDNFEEGVEVNVMNWLRIKDMWSSMVIWWNLSEMDQNSLKWPRYTENMREVSFTTMFYKMRWMELVGENSTKKVVDWIEITEYRGLSFQEWEVRPLALFRSSVALNGIDEWLWIKSDVWNIFYGLNNDGIHFLLSQ